MNSIVINNSKQRYAMNTFLKETLWLFAVFFLCGTFFSCEEYGGLNDYYYAYRGIECDDSVYDKTEGIYKGELSLLRLYNDSYDETNDSVDVRLGNHVNKELEIMELPVKKLFNRNYEHELLADIPSWALEKKINITFKYTLYLNIGYDESQGYEQTLVDSIISNYLSYNSASMMIEHYYNHYADSVYNEDKTQKLKLDVESEVRYLMEGEAIMLYFNKLEINDKVFIDEKNNPRYLKIIISGRRRNI